MFGEQLARVWDTTYQDGRGKDYHGEAELVARVVRERLPGASSLLDVGCGTGEHLAALSRVFEHVEGMDLSPDMAAIARDKVPGVSVHVGDMTEFDLGRTFDAVVSLYTVVGYLPSLDALRSAVAAMVRHLAPGGVLVVEPWWFAEDFLDGYVAADTIRAADRTVSRVSLTRERAGRAEMDIHFLVADGESVEHFSERHDFGLWSLQDYESCFDAAGCDVEFVPDVLYCGMFVARRR